MQRKEVRKVMGSHYPEISIPDDSRLPIGFEEKHCYGEGVKNCMHFRKYACPGSCKWAEEMMNPKGLKPSPLETSVRVPVK